MRIFKSNKTTNYSTTLGGKSFKELEELRENKVNNKLTNNTYLTREEYNKSRISKELQELEEELKVKQGHKHYKERVKLIKSEIKYKEKELRELGKARAKSKSKLELLKELFSFR
ncbi:TPA: hypothetical protein ACOTHO_001393 [Clostridium perfringens]|uniref:hypothetical protein n=1 Tax=Clostridium perfringens TaxID=1502 RepID=UPI000D8D5676|nr:hypothetical protein [Clostridium perfringens]MDK0805255.1 hypothetical protein [Clostridium perfringens]MDM0618342.1 hypothetical protein [Clostridium perfringens]MDM0991326.1 hypothetical protein [Clostridium perfringens]PWW83889.1 hypothetical protein CYK87_12090 [Clostridium perfringens]PWX27525.1 hypothetical protein CYK95_07305 [Clostridium perfringens]